MTSSSPGCYTPTAPRQPIEVHVSSRRELPDASRELGFQDLTSALSCESPSMTTDLTILFADRHMLAVVKPARMPLASDASRDDTLLQRVRLWNEERQEEGRKGYCVPIHFLDRPVSGVVLFGLSSKGAMRLNEQFRQRTLRKTYVAIVHGCPQKPEGRLEHYLSKDKRLNVTRLSHAQDKEAKRSVLRYRVLASQGGLSLVAIEPETGRSHQIRVQLASLGTPIYGDGKYGASSSWDGTIALHALQLRLKHPVSKDELRLEAPLPPRWQALWPDTLRGQDFAPFPF